jgi:hypothetical protein
MDGLSILFGILTFTFLIFLIGMNFVNRRPTMSMKEGFASVEGATELTPASSEIELMIRAGMDKMALHTSPDGTPIKDGADLCDIFQKIRVSMSSGKQAMSKSKADIADANAKADAKESVNVTIKATAQSNDAEIVKQVDDELRILIPGGFLSCPLLQYPPSGASDDVWLSWLQELPRDFAARVFFMSLFVDERAADMVSKLETQLNTPIDLSTIPQIVIQESFASICTPGLSEVKQKNADAASCVDISVMTQDQKKAFVTYVLNDMLETKRQKILKQFNVRGNDSSESAGTNDDIRKHISNAKANLAKMQDIGENVLNGTMIPKSFDNVKEKDTSSKKCAKRYSAVP